MKAFIAAAAVSGMLFGLAGHTVESDGAGRFAGKASSAAVNNEPVCPTLAAPAAVASTALASAALAQIGRAHV